VALVGLGLTGMYIARYRKRGSRGFSGFTGNERFPRGARIPN
jgi:hypothetical protein